MNFKHDHRSKLGYIYPNLLRSLPHVDTIPPAHDPALALFNRLLSPMSACFRASLRFKQSTILGASV
jgi:hypothetical protein